MTQPNEDGFQRTASDMHNIRQDNDRIQQNIADGLLRMQPEAADQAIAAYKKAAGKAYSLVREAASLDELQGLGDYPSARQLTEKFKNKARNGHTGAADLIREYADELRRRAHLIEEAKRAYLAQEEQVSHEFNKLQKGME